MKSAKEFRDFFAAIPDEKWTQGTYSDGQGRCCAMGHVGPYTEGGHLLRKIVGDALDCGVGSINDATPWCPKSIKNLPTPKARILAALDEIIASETKSNP